MQTEHHSWGPRCPRQLEPPGLVHTPVPSFTCSSQRKRRGIVQDLCDTEPQCSTGCCQQVTCLQGAEHRTCPWCDLAPSQVSKEQQNSSSLYTLHLKAHAPYPMHCRSIQISSQSRLVSIMLVGLPSISASPPVAMIISMVHMCFDLFSLCILCASFLWLCHEPS